MPLPFQTTQPITRGLGVPVDVVAGGSPMNDVTRILLGVEQGDPHASDQLLPLVYDELRRLATAKMAREKPGQTLQATALVHEAYLRLVDQEQSQHWNNRRHFFAAAAEAMRRILVENARRKGTRKHGRRFNRVDLDQVEIADEVRDDDLLALDEALTLLTEEDPQTAELVKLRYFSGLSNKEAAEVLGISPRTADFRWAFARAWLFEKIEGDSSHPTPAGPAPRPLS